jgi:hypothetical protein
MKKALVTCALAAGVGLALAIGGGTAQAAVATTAVNAAAVTPLAATVPASTPISETPLAMSTTNGDILAIRKIAGAPTNELAIGGNFTAVITPDGKSHAAKNFAVLNESTGAVIFAGNANSYVRAFASYGGKLYLGGDFTTLGGVARTHVAAYSSTFALQPFNPAPSARVRGMEADASGVYFGGDNGYVRKVNSTSGATIWSQTLTGGGIHALQLTPDAKYLFVGGMYEKYGSLTQHGLVKVLASTGANVAAFVSHFKADSGVGSMGAYDGEEAVSFALSPEGTYIVVGIAGHGTDEVRKLNMTTGAQIWNKYTSGDCQAVVQVGSTYVTGFHRNQANQAYPYPYFSGQLEGSNAQLTNWDPKLTGNQSNADGGNNGIQSMYADPVSKVIYIAGAFTHWNGTATHKSLIAFKWS